MIFYFSLVYTLVSYAIYSLVVGTWFTVDKRSISSTAILKTSHTLVRMQLRRPNVFLTRFIRVRESPLRCGSKSQLKVIKRNLKTHEKQNGTEQNLFQHKKRARRHRSGEMFVVELFLLVPSPRRSSLRLKCFRDTERAREKVKLENEKHFFRLHKKRSQLNTFSLILYFIFRFHNYNVSCSFSQLLTRKAVRYLPSEASEKRNEGAQ